MAETRWKEPVPPAVRALDELARALEERAASPELVILCLATGALKEGAHRIRLSGAEADAAARLLRATVAREGAI